MENRSTTAIGDNLGNLYNAIGMRQIDRRRLLRRALALGLSAPAIAGLLAACGGDDDELSGSETDATNSTQTPAVDTASASTPSPANATGAVDTLAGGAGVLRLLWWQAPTVINPHFSLGGKDTDASRVCYEPLADFDSEGGGIPVLAAEMPSLDNGGVAPDGLSVTWKLRKGVTWHDGEPFDADDVRFTFEYVTNAATAATTISTYAIVEAVEVIDPQTVKVNFSEPNPGWLDIFTGSNGMIVPEHVFRDFVGENARDAPANLLPVGTGPFKVREFRPGDVVLYDRFAEYWDTGKPYFDAVELKGGGDAPGTARAVLVSGEGDWAANLQVEPGILTEMAERGVGVIVSNPGASTERLCLNYADPNLEVDGARSEPTTQHPLFKHKDVREAVALAIQRDAIVEQLYGAGGQVSANIVNAPERYISPNTSWEYNLDKAQALLDAAGVTDGTLIYQTTVNSVRQKTQEIIKQDLEKLGLTVEIKSIDASVFFSSDAGNPDTYGHFYADMQMYTDGPVGPYLVTWMDQWRTDTIASKANTWSGTNTTRYSNPEFDALHDQARVELDPDKQIEQIVALNDLVVNDFAE
ncbi:MAG: peptide ABC transporter substrate-binding protein, partial [Chloroflexota bacterium]|nr:peptide ABC transporter substrate-binding protein [Chloroflexota bacterium]